MTLLRTPIEQARMIFTTGKIIHDRVHRIITAHLASGRKQRNFAEISVSQFHMLMVIRSRGQVSIKQLSELLGVSPPSASTMVDRLVEKGILTREQDRTDRRKVAIRVSRIAMRQFEKAEETVLKSFVNLVEKLGSEKSSRWCAVLEDVKTAIEEDENETPLRKNMNR